MKTAYHPDTTVVDWPNEPLVEPSQDGDTMIGLPAPARLPASPPQRPGAGYLRKYPVKLDDPIEVVLHWGDGIDWSAR